MKIHSVIGDTTLVTGVDDYWNTSKKWFWTIKNVPALKIQIANEWDEQRLDRHFDFTYSVEFMLLVETITTHQAIFVSKYTEANA